MFDYKNVPFEFKWVGHLNDKGKAINTGDAALNNVVNALGTLNLSQKIVCLYDCDTNKQASDNNNVFVRSIPQFPIANGMDKGIENALVFDGIDLTQFYNEKQKNSSYGQTTTIREFNKMKCCARGNHRNRFIDQIINKCDKVSAKY